MLDIWRNDAFNLVPLTIAMNNLRYVPGRIGDLGIFAERGVSVLSISIEQKNNQLIIIPPSPRGGPGMTFDKLKRNLRMVSIPHFQVDDTMMGEELQGVRAFGSETAVETMQTKLAERSLTVTQGFELTAEYARMGAINGVVTYADGTSLDLYSIMGVSKLPMVFLDLNPGTPAAGGTVRRKTQELWRLIEDELDGLPFSGIRALCGNAFFDALIQDPDIRTTYLNQIGASELRTGYITPGQRIYSSFVFGDIIWENYRGSVNGVAMVPTDECRFIPEGVPELFMTVYAPADYLETVNTTGIRMYTKQWTMPNDKGINLEWQSNALHFCTRPRVLISGKRTAS